MFRTRPSIAHQSRKSVYAAMHHGFLARKLMPTVPNASALEACGAPANTLAFQGISKSTNPADVTTLASSASSRAPAIHPVHKSIFSLADAGTALLTRISPI